MFTDALCDREQIARKDIHRDERKMISHIARCARNLRTCGAAKYCTATSHVPHDSAGAGFVRGDERGDDVARFGRKTRPAVDDYLKLVLEA